MSDDKCSVMKVIRGSHVTDGAGVSLYRIMPTNTLDNIDPFFLLDEFKSEDPDDYIAGFPMHPHRGIETITYMLEGHFTHRDSKGHRGRMGPGDVQWMTAGRGILHEEMPAMNDGKLWGYQLWLNLPRKLKMVPPRYQHLDSSEMPVVDGEGLRVRVISGEYGGRTGPAKNHVPSTYLDVRLFEDARFDLKVEPGNNKFVYVHSGRVAFGEHAIGKGEVGMLGDGTAIEAEGIGESSGFLLFAGIPNNEPVARGGPFIMNTREEIYQAFEDYRNGVLHI
ncbi:MAG: pirin family protein [Thermoplasmatota archaeon]